MLKKLTLVLLFVILGFLITGLIVGVSSSVNNNTVYKSFLEGLIVNLLKPGGESFDTWVNGLKGEKGYEVSRIKFCIEIKEVEEKEGDALVLFELKFKIYCKTSGGSKITVKVNRPAIAIITVNPKSIDDLKYLKAGKETSNIENGWNGQIDI